MNHLPNFHDNKRACINAPKERKDIQLHIPDPGIPSSSKNLKK